MFMVYIRGEEIVFLEGTKSFFGLLSSNFKSLLP